MWNRLAAGLGAMVLLFGASAPARAGTCDGPPVSPGSLALIDEAAQEHADRRARDAFIAAVEQAETAVPCLDGALTPLIAARFHLMAGVRAHAAGAPKLHAGASRRPGPRMGR